MTQDQQSMFSSPAPLPPYMPLAEFVRRLLVLGALGLLVIVLWQLRVVLIMTFLAIIIAISLDVPIRRLQERGMRRGLAMLVVTTVTVTLLVLTILLIGTPIVVETQSLIEDLPEAIDRLSDDYANLSQNNAFLPDVNFQTSVDDSQPLDILTPDFIINEGASFLTSVGTSIVNIGFNLLIVIIIALYLLAAPETYANSILALVPKSHQVRILKIMIDLRESLVAWLVTQLISMLIIGVLITVVLGIVWGVPNALALGVLAGLLTFIPNFGSIIAVIPAIIFTLADRPAFLLPVILTYIVVQQFESNFITPMVVKQRLDIPAAALLIFQVMMGVLFGFLGLLIAIPLFMVIKELVRELYVDDVLNNINTSIEARSTAQGETVVRVTGDNFQSDEIPLKRIFGGTDPFDQSLQKVLDSNDTEHADSDHNEMPEDEDYNTWQTEEDFYPEDEPQDLEMRQFQSANTRNLFEGDAFEDGEGNREDNINDRDDDSDEPSGGDTQRRWWWRG